MFLKTLKHDLKNSFKDYSMLYITMLAFALLAPFGIQSQSPILIQISAIGLSFIVIGAIIMTFMNSINFLKRRLFDEGAYFNLTLPVSIDTTLISKIVTVSIWQIVTVLMVIISGVIFSIFIREIGIENVTFFFSKLFEIISQADFLGLFLGLILMMISMFSFTTLLIVVMALVNTSAFTRRNYFFSILFFILFSWGRGIVDDAVDSLVIGDRYQTWINMTANSTGVPFVRFFDSWQHSLFYITYELLWLIGLYMLARYLMTKKLEI